MATPPSGQQYEITLGDQRAVIVEVGGAVRAYRHGERDVLHPFGLDAMSDGGHGAPLIPWPNRLADGRYTFDGVDYQVELSEPDKHNAIHGFLRWRNWQAVEHGEQHVVMSCRLYAQKGYPFSLEIDVRYELGEAGLLVTTTATNIGDRAAPFGCGQHPYLSPGPGLVDDATLRFGAATRIDTDPQRQLPTGRVPVDGTAYDFGAARHLGDFAMDYAFTDLERDADGRAWLWLTGADGATVALWAGPDYPVLEVYTADTLSPDRRRRALAVEPMSCPPDAFRSGENLIRLEPDESVVHTWGVGLLDD